MYFDISGTRQLIIAGIYTVGLLHKGEETVGLGFDAGGINIKNDGGRRYFSIRQQFAPEIGSAFRDAKTAYKEGLFCSGQYFSGPEMEVVTQYRKFKSTPQVKHL